MIENRQTKSSGLAERLRAELLAGQYPSGSPVASVRELAKRYGISTVTADKILRQLVKEDFLYRVPQSGTFIKHDPPPVPVIGYAGCLPDPADKWSSILQTAYRHLQDYLAEQKFEQHIIPYHELRHGAQAEKRLKHLNGLLLSASFIDDVTLPVIRKFKGRIVLMDNVSIFNQFPCSQVIPDYTPALREFVERYDCLVAVMPQDAQLEKLAEFPDKVLFVNRYGADLNYISTNHRAAVRELVRYNVTAAGGGAQHHPLRHRRGEAGAPL